MPDPPATDPPATCCEPQVPVTHSISVTTTWLARVRGVFALRSRTYLLVWLTLALAGTFAVTAWRTARVERAKVESTTCFLAADAARVLQGRSEMYLGTMTEPIFAAVGSRASLVPVTSLPPPDVLKRADAAVARCHCAPRLAVRAYFRLLAEPDGRAGTLLVIPADSGTVEDSSTTGFKDPGPSPVPFVAPDDTRLKEAVWRVMPELREGGVVAAAVTGTASGRDTLRVVAVVSPKFDANGQLRAVYGLLVTPTDFASQVVGRVFDRVPLFPQELADSSYRQRAVVWGHGGKTPNGEIANLAVFDAKYVPLHQTGPIADMAPTAPGCVGATWPEASLASIMLLVSPPLPVFDRWTANSMATEQLPFLVAILIGMLGCVGAAALAARREVELARLRSDFVSSISHELRMPLAQILLSGETLSLGRTRTQAERDDAADAIVREAHRLTGLVDNALFFSRIEHHNVRVAPERVELSQVVDEALTGIAPIAQGAEATVLNTVAAGSYAMLDRSAFRQVLYNLLENAIKYGPPGQTVLVGAAPSSTAPDRLRIWVEDEGPGIPKGQKSRIFEPFVRLERDAEMHVAGSGLGLAVVAHIVSLHDGHAWIEQGRWGKGSRFVVDIPRGGPPVDAQEFRAEESDRSDPPHHDAAD